MNRLTKREVSVQGWEDADFPILCHHCLGKDPAIRMQKERFGTECKVCLRPYTTFRWTPGLGLRFRRTLICPTCSNAKNVCQSCILDLKYGLPVQVRDQILGIEDETPEQTTNRDHFFQIRSPNPAKFDRGKNGSVGKEALLSLKTQFEQNNDLLKYRNLPYVCSFFLKGQCNRGSSCPYSHDPLAEAELNRTKIMNRYFGRKDPVADQILQQFKNYPPAFYDKSICSICIHSINVADVNEEYLRSVFDKFGDIKSIVIVKEEQIAFVNFLDRNAADQAVEEYLEDGIEHAGDVMRVTWAYGKPKGPKQEFTFEIDEAKLEPQSKKSKPPTVLPLPGSTGLKYASMDPHQLGTVVRK